MTTRIAILASGSGTTAQSLLDAWREDELSGAEVSILLSDRSRAGALDRARTAGVETVVWKSSDFDGDRVEYCRTMAEFLKDRGVDLVCAAGFMKILAEPFIKAYEGKILNTHPSLLPAFPGAHAVRDTLAYGVKVTGATIHFVDDQVDHGPILLQEAVAVLDDDDEDTLHERIKQVERRLYPEAVRAVVAGRVGLEGRRTLIA